MAGVRTMPGATVRSASCGEPAGGSSVANCAVALAVVRFGRSSLGAHFDLPKMDERTNVGFDLAVG